MYQVHSGGCLEFFIKLAKKLVPPRSTTTDYHTIEVFSGSGFQKCYLGTQQNDMLFAPAFPDGNLSGKQNMS